MGFAVKSKLVKDLNLSPSYANKRIISLRMPLIKSHYLTVISAHAPTLNAIDDDKSSFYTTFSRVLVLVPSSGKLLLIGYFNTQVGTDSNVWKAIIGN